MRPWLWGPQLFHMGQSNSYPGNLITESQVHTLDRSTPVRACTEAGSSASSRFTSDVTLLLSPVRTTISSTLVNGAATLAAI